DLVTKYEALSYTWGTENSDKYIISDGFHMPVTENLYDALQMIRRTREESFYIWVDSICINQADKIEKAHQVWNMLTIYEKAEKVVVWLG
ncbi:hypothetical protein K491DRAFT_548880, partial [Lophiostoma macrostomum CBS 122681]